MRQRDSAESRGSGIPVRDLREDARSLTSDEFEDRHGHAFLLLTAAELRVPRGPATTQVQLLDDVAAPGESTANLSLLAYPLRRNPRSAGHLITLGRGSDNDVVVPDLSISRFHAFAKEGDGGSWLLLDAGSTNGTTVNGLSAPQQGLGAPRELKSGDSVRLGQVEFTFLDAPALIGFAKKLQR